MDSDPKVLELGRVALRKSPYVPDGGGYLCMWCDFSSLLQDKDPDRHTLDCPWQQATVARRQELES